MDELNPKREKAPVSHRLYDKLGLSMSLKAIDGFILTIVVLLAGAIILGIIL